MQESHMDSKVNRETQAQAGENCCIL